MKRRYLAIFLLFAILGECRSISSSYPWTGVYHTVKRHQTLWRISKTYGVDMDEVARVNHIPDPSKIRVGQKIFIPGAKKVLKVDIYIEDIGGRKGRREDPERIALAKGRFIWPVRGKVTREFGIRGTTKHDGIDISAPMGTPIKASNSGRVLYSGNEVRGYGNIILLKHEEGFITVYAHNEINGVVEGEKVGRGQILGRVGRTGRTSGPNLHFEIRMNNRPINPRLLLD
ncbi:MAG: peptidoglycan DD-metalloendopeptidase family protein [Proteobacteria bacterium]|nr:peptidoglycan DD-metalloendopeptidase family protein [Pseudomonadota bacterium]